MSVKRGSLVRVPVENHALRLCLNVNGAENRAELINSSKGFSFGIDHDLLRIKRKRYMG